MNSKLLYFHCLLLFDQESTKGPPTTTTTTKHREYVLMSLFSIVLPVCIHAKQFSIFVRSIRLNTFSIEEFLLSRFGFCSFCYVCFDKTFSSSQSYLPSTSVQLLCTNTKQLNGSNSITNKQQQNGHCKSLYCDPQAKTSISCGIIKA